MRAGFAGEDVPKSVVPSYYGILESQKLLFGDNSIHTPAPNFAIRNPIAKDGTVEDWDVAKKLWEYAVTSRLTNTKPSDPATNGLNDSTDVDMDAAVDAVEEREKPLEELPLMMSETGWNSAKAREKSAEIAIEEWGCPAFWLARNGVLAASGFPPDTGIPMAQLTHVAIYRFAGGKASALVIDVGASNLSVTPVHDGLVLRKGRC